MNLMRDPHKIPLQLALGGIFAALVFIVTGLVPWIPIPATGGFFNFGETVIYIAALLFGPLTGGVAGGIGASLADAYTGFAAYAPGTFAIKTVEGALVGFLNWKLRHRVRNTTLCASIAGTVGGLEMVLGYFLYSQLVLGYPLAGALAEVPFNLAQMVIGLAVAVPVMHAVLRVFPQLKSQLSIS